MDKLEKPKFITTPILANVSILLGIVATFSFSKNLSDIMQLIIIISLIGVFIVWNLIKYIKNWFRFYKDYLSLYETYNNLIIQHSELAKQFDTKKMKIGELNKLLDEYKLIIKHIQLSIKQGTLPVSDYEKKYLLNLYDVILRDAEHLYKLEGGNENGKDL